MQKITHIITGLNGGGAETMLYKLLVNIDRNKYKLSVISMMDKGVFGSKIETLGIEVHTLNMTRGIPSVTAFFQTFKLCRDADIIQTWMYHADFLGAVIKMFNRKVKLIWGIRLSSVKPDKDRKSTVVIAKISARISRWLPDVITSNSWEGIRFHSELGYCAEKMKYLPNGIDLERFYKRNAERNILVDEGYIDSNFDGFTIVTVGRWDIQKGYQYLIKAVSVLALKNMDFRLIMCGKGLEPSNEELSALIRENNLASRHIITLGRREDICDIFSCCDIYISSAIDEGFSNAIGEAMACELPCIVTDVGDSAYVVADTGFVIKAYDANEIVNAIEKTYSMDKCILQKLGEKARKRMKDYFDIKNVVELFEELYV